MKIGDKVWLLPLRRNRSGIKESFISKCGNKYIYVDACPRDKFDKNNGYEVTEYTPSYRIFFTLEELELYNETIQLKDKITSFFYNGKVGKLNIDQLRSIHKILEGTT